MLDRRRRDGHRPRAAGLLSVVLLLSVSVAPGSPGSGSLPSGSTDTLDPRSGRDGRRSAWICG